MSTTLADIYCAEGGAVQLYHKKVQELTCLVSSSLPYLYRTAVRRSRQASVPLDGQGPDANTFAEMLSESRPNPEEECRRVERTELLAHLLGMLSPILRHTFQLRHVNGLSIRETAHLLGIPEGTVKARVARARSKLKQLLQKRLGATL